MKNRDFSWHKKHAKKLSKRKKKNQLRKIPFAKISKLREQQKIELDKLIAGISIWKRTWWRFQHFIRGLANKIISKFK